MKSKIFAALLSVIVLTASSKMWLGYKSVIDVGTTVKNAEITLSYRKKSDSALLTVKAKTDGNGDVRFKLKSKTVATFKIGLPQNGSVKTAYFDGWRKIPLSLTDGAYDGGVLRGRVRKIDFYNLAMSQQTVDK